MVSDLAQQVFARVDAKDAAGFAALFEPEGRCTFGNYDALVGTEQIEAAAASFLASIAAISHSIRHEWVIGDDTIVEAQVAYTRLDGRDVTVPVVSIWRTGAGGMIEDYRVFYDLAPVFA